MRLTLIGACMTCILLVMGACGIPEEQHNAVLKDLEGCKKTLGDTKNRLSEVEGDKNKLEQEVVAKRKQITSLDKEMSKKKKELDALRKAQAAAEARAKVYKQLMARLQSMIDSGKLKVEIRKGRMIVKLSDKILFDPGKTKLKEDGQAALKQVAAALKEINDRDFLVAGHTDNVPIKSRQFKSNWELSAARGVEVVKFLQQEGVDPKHLGAAGFSEFDPVGDNSTDDGTKTNRRIEIVLMPNIEEMPKMD
jgi:chemotaxis protein MotB